MFKYLIIFSIGFLSSAFILFFLGKLSSKYKMLNLRGVPLVGGMGVWLAFTFAILAGSYIFQVFPRQVLLIFSIASVILFSGIIDDLKEMSVLQKFLVQSFCALVLIFFDVRTHIVYLGVWGNIAVTYLWIVGITNAFNLLDIMDGLAAGAALIISFALFILALLNFSLIIQILTLSLFSGILGFLIFNFPPAKLYLGNSGSHFLGFILAAFTLISQYASLNNGFALFAPVLIFWLPISDTLLLIIFRVLRKKIPFSKSKDHIVFKARLLGFSNPQILGFMCLLCLISSVAGLTLTRVNNQVSVVIISGVCVTTILLFLKLRKVIIYE